MYSICNTQTSYVHHYALSFVVITDDNIRSVSIILRKKYYVLYNKYM
jgi:hypothetical protein